MHWKNAQIHVVDFEGSLASGIVEFGVVTLRGGEIETLRTRLCAPTGQLRREDTARHGLTAEMIAGELSFSEEWELFASLRETGPLAAHFCGTENALLRAVWPYTRPAPNFLTGDGAQTNDWGPWIDTGRLVRVLFGNVASARLEDLVAAFGVTDELRAAAEKLCPPKRKQFHAAGYDALATALLLRAILREPAYAEASVSWLLEKSAAASEDAGQMELL